MKRPTTLLCRVLVNLGLQTSVAVEVDIEVIRRRFEHEGWSFLTITLPMLCDALDQGLAQGRLTHTLWTGFKPFRRGGRLPAFLSGFFRRVFNEDGSLKDIPCIDSIRAIRQVTRLFKKVEMPCSPSRIREAYERYVSNDESISGGASYPDLFDRVAGYLWSDLEEFSGELYCSPGSFGPGATAERSTPNGRYSIKQWHERAEGFFPSSFHGSHREDDTDSFEGIEYLSLECERPVRVVQVPKTLKSPRTISVEPSYMMLMQQSVARPLMAYLESGRFRYGSIRFTDQTVNRDLARIGSIDGSLSTIDLKDASDLVSYDVVKRMFRQCPTFFDFIDACRSRRAQLPDNSSITLKKFASMGSALCFPIEAMTFFTIVMMSLVRQSGRSLSKGLLHELSAKVAVYGDDIILPTQTAVGVMEDLQSFGLKVNREKSFYTGLFRESCGGDYYMGHDVTPAYCRRWAGTDVAFDSGALASYVSLSNQLYVRGLWNATQYIRDYVQRRAGPIPRTRVPVGVQSFASCLYDTGLRWDKDRSGWRVKGPALIAGKSPDRVQDIRAAMLRCFGNADPDRRNDEADLVHIGQKLVEFEFGPYANDRSQEIACDRHSSESVGRVSTPSTQGGPDIYSSADNPRGLGDHVPWDRRSVLRYWVQELATSSRSRIIAPIDKRLEQSVTPYAVNMKRRWSPVHRTGMPGW